MRILVVEDEAEVNAVVEEALDAFGYDVDAVRSAEEALTLLEQIRYDIVISDVGLPGMSGTALAETIARERPRLANRLILLTGRFGETPASLPVISKPFSVHDIVQAVEELVVA